MLCSTLSLSYHCANLSLLCMPLSIQLGNLEWNELFRGQRFLAVSSPTYLLSVSFLLINTAMFMSAATPTNSNPDIPATMLSLASAPPQPHRHLFMRPWYDTVFEVLLTLFHRWEGYMKLLKEFQKESPTHYALIKSEFKKTLDQSHMT